MARQNMSRKALVNLQPQALAACFRKPWAKPFRRQCGFPAPAMTADVPPGGAIGSGDFRRPGKSPRAVTCTCSRIPRSRSVCTVALACVPQGAMHCVGRAEPAGDRRSRVRPSAALKINSCTALSPQAVLPPSYEITRPASEPPAHPSASENAADPNEKAGLKHLGVLP
jgi:hypothetical protein